MSYTISTGGHQSRAPWEETVQTILSPGSREWFLPNSIPNPSLSGPPLDMLQNQLPSQDLQGEPGRAGLLAFPVCLSPQNHREEFTAGVRFSHQRQSVLLYLEIYQLINGFKSGSSWETARKSPRWQACYLLLPSS